MKILILDDHPLIPDFLTLKILEIYSSSEVLVANSLEQAQFLLTQNQVDRVICDLQIIRGKSLLLPEYCCINQIPFMVYSSHVNYSLIKVLKELKVNCYVSKGSKTECLVEGLKKLMANDIYYCPSVQLEAKNENGADVPKPDLSNSEYKVFKAYSLGMNTEEVANLLGLKTVTVRNHRARAMDKNLCSYTELLDRFKFWEV